MQKTEPRIWSLGRKVRPALDPGEADGVLKKIGKGRGLHFPERETDARNGPVLVKQRPECSGEPRGNQEDKALHTVLLIESLQSGTVVQCQPMMPEDYHRLRDRLPDSSLVPSESRVDPVHLD